jgi:RNA polymerase sigma-70 factor (ECF subfamily)
MEFETTRWSLIASARDSDKNAEKALEDLCQAYWKPVFTYVCRRGFRPDKAEELAQEFFVRLLEKDVVTHADQSRGRFRHFLQASIRNFISNERDKVRAQKRGGGLKKLEIDGLAGAADTLLIADEQLSPDVMFDRSWALTLIDNVFETLRREWADRGKSELYEALECRLTGARLGEPYADVAKRLGMTEAAVKLAANRMRSRYRDLLRAEVLDTVSSESELEMELQDLHDTLAGL